MLMHVCTDDNPEFSTKQRGNFLFPFATFAFIGCKFPAKAMPVEGIGATL